MDSKREAVMAKAREKRQRRNGGHVIRRALIGGFAAALVLIGLGAGVIMADEHSSHHPGGGAAAPPGAPETAPSAPTDAPADVGAAMAHARCKDWEASRADRGGIANSAVYDDAGEPPLFGVCDHHFADERVCQIAAPVDDHDIARSRHIERLV